MNTLTAFPPNAMGEASVSKCAKHLFDSSILAPNISFPWEAAEILPILTIFTQFCLFTPLLINYISVNIFGCYNNSDSCWFTKCFELNCGWNLTSNLDQILACGKLRWHLTGVIFQVNHIKAVFDYLKLTLHTSVTFSPKMQKHKYKNIKKSLSFSII